MKKGGKGIIIFLILIIIALIAGGAYAYFMTDLFKTPEQLFKKYFLSNVIQLTESNFQPFDEVYERMDNELTESSLNITYNGNSENSDEEANTYNVNLKLNTDLPNRNEALEVAVKQNDDVLVEGTLALTDETLGIQIPDLHEKFIALENRDFKKLGETFELPDEYIEMIPDKITEPSPFTDEEKEKINQLYTKYMDKILAQLDENSYVAEKNINVTLNSGETLVSDRYTLSVSTKKIYTIFTTALQELLNDEEFLALCKDRIDEKYLEELKTSYTDYLNENSVDDIEESTIKISVYAVEGKTVKTEFINENNSVSFMIDNKENESTISAITVEGKSDINEVETTSTAIIKNKFINNVGELSYEVKTEYNQEDVAALESENDSTTDEFGDSYDYSAELYEDETVKVIFKTKKVNENNISAEVSFDGDGLEEINKMLTIKLGYKFGSAKVTQITNENSLIVNDYTMEDFQNLVTEITQNVMETAIEKPESLIGMILLSFSDDSDYGTDVESPSSEDLYTYTDYDPDYTTDEEFTDMDTDTGSEYDETLDMDYTADGEEEIFPTEEVDPEALRIEIDDAITDGLQECLDNYKEELLINPDANLGDFLTVENVQAYCGDDYQLELPDGTTIRCETQRNGEMHIYYALMNIDGDNLVVTDVEVLTESEYLNR